MARFAPSGPMPALMPSCAVVVGAMIAAINLALPKLSGTVHAQATDAFTTAMAIGYRVIALIVLITAM